ncbi:putative von Willebrand factor, type A, von Willebrand factor A-like domain superfamily [Helianthus annuus]|nr:putative von Willebrand factor, type A, von Willebrand factor A-like domain superfamily [Helianthus annuus]
MYNNMTPTHYHYHYLYLRLTFYFSHKQTNSSLLTIFSGDFPMAVDNFSRSVHTGLQICKRISYGKDKASMTAPKAPSMKKSSSSSTSSSLRQPENHLPTAPMVYAVIVDPSIVDNPDICSYQPYVYGHCDPPALVPLHMHGVTMEVDCCLDTAFVTVRGTWRLHCVASSASCDCKIAIPMGEQGSVLGIEVETPRRSYSTQFATAQSENDVTKTSNGYLMKGNTYMLKIFQVEGGSHIHVNVRWSQKLLYQNNEFCLSVPFTFPVHVVPVVKGYSMKEKVLLNVNSCTDKEIMCNVSTHPLKETRRQAGELGFSYEADVQKWSTQDFYFSFSVCEDDIFAGVLLQSPSLQDCDQRDMFCFYLFPGSNKNIKPWRKEVVFMVDISASMQDDPLERSKDAVIGCLSELNQQDSFNIIAFNGDIQLFSSSLELATNEAITNATKWMNTNLIAAGGTNLLTPLKQALEMVGKTGESIPFIFLITDGSVEDEKDICNMTKDHLMEGETDCPRICTFGIGSYCNHYFLQMLAHMGRGCYDAAYDVDSISERLPRMFNNALSPVLTNITLDALQNLDSTELYPFRIPDLFGSPLVVSGRYHGNFPDIVTARGIRADLSTCVIDVKVRKAKGIPLDRVCARREIDTLTAHAWLYQNTQIEKKIANMSLQMGVPSEYTCMILVQSDKIKLALDSVQLEEKCSKLENRKMIYLRNISVGFGDLKATIDNLPPGIVDLEVNEPAGIMMQAASSCWGMFLDRCCCMCLIQSCSRMNDQCAIVLTQLCTALACFECLNWCCELCDCCSDFC